MKRGEIPLPCQTLVACLVRTDITMGVVRLGRGRRPPLRPGRPPPRGRGASRDPLGKEVVALVVHDDEGREVHDLDPPDGLHAQLRILQHLHLLDAVLRQDRRRAPNRPQVEPPVLLARRRHGLRPVALGQHDEAAALGHEAVDVGVHAPGGGGAEGPGGEALGGLGGAGVVHRVVFEVLGQPLPGLDALEDLRVGDVAGHDQRPRQTEARRDGVLGQLIANLGHGLVQVDLDGLRRGGARAGEALVRDLREVLGDVRLELLQEHPLRRDLALALPVGGARHADAHGARGPVARQPHDAHVVAEVLAPELRPDAHLLRELEDLLLQGNITEGPAVLVPFSRQVVVVLCGGHLHRLQRQLCGEAPDDDGQVVRGARRRPEGLDVVFEELHEGLGVEEGLGLLVQEGLVGAPAALGNELEVVLVAGRRVEVDLGGQVGLRVDLLVHVQGGGLGVAEVGAGVRVIDPVRQMRLVLPVREHVLPAFAGDDGRARVLAPGQHHVAGDVGVLQELEGHEPVVGRGLGVLQDLRQLPQVRGAQEVRNVHHRLRGEQAQGLGLDLQELHAIHCDGADVVGGQLLVRRRGVRGQVE
mmetsp:Transcript_29571/g.50209  ORF Transcript_29571/g.50209 Transcript_29571/m.50209 type:complete len:587 (-) Transcript_29571:115-1875(-)